MSTPTDANRLARDRLAREAHLLERCRAPFVPNGSVRVGCEFSVGDLVKWRDYHARIGQILTGDYAHLRVLSMGMVSGAFVNLCSLELLAPGDDIEGIKAYLSPAEFFKLGFEVPENRDRWGERERAIRRDIDRAIVMARETT